MKCPHCSGKGWYLGVVPPGKDVKTPCSCTPATPSAPDKCPGGGIHAFARSVKMPSHCVKCGVSDESIAPEAPFETEAFGGKMTVKVDPDLRENEYYFVHEPTVPEACTNCDEPTSAHASWCGIGAEKPSTFEQARDAQAEAYGRGWNPANPNNLSRSFRDGADFGYAKGRTTYSKSELEMAKLRAQEKRASLFGDLVVKEEIDRLTRELAEAKAEIERMRDSSAYLQAANHLLTQAEKLTAELAEANKNYELMRSQFLSACESINALRIIRDELREKLERAEKVSREMFGPAGVKHMGDVLNERDRYKAALEYAKERMRDHGMPNAMLKEIERILSRKEPNE